MVSSILVGSWVRVAVTVAMVFVISTILLLQVNTVIVRWVEYLLLFCHCPMYVIEYCIGTVQLVSLLSNRSEVESAGESLLEWKGGEVKADEGGERCLYEYNLTLTFEPTMGR